LRGPVTPVCIDPRVSGLIRFAHDISNHAKSRLADRE
jgi:hypothetical protein